MDFLHSDSYLLILKYYLFALFANFPVLDISSKHVFVLFVYVFKVFKH